MSSPRRSKTMAAVLALLLVSGGAALAGDSASAPVAEREFTLGIVQKELRVGMSQTDVVTALGSPNILTRGADGREAWVYDRVASEAHFRSKGFGGGAGGAFAPGTSLILGLLSGHVRDDRTQTTQRTLTVVVRFGTDADVESFSFHASRF
jgi:hypothetical protein